MLNPNMLLCLYTRVREDTSLVNGVGEKDMKLAIEQMHMAYKGTEDNLNKSFHCLTDFNEVAYRCAYLFKYAPFHTALSFKAMSHALAESPCELGAVLDSLSEPLKICSLGGGPGADMIGVVAAMHNQYGFFRCSAKLVDLKAEWELTFGSILDELRQQNYGPLSESMSDIWFDWSYMAADLQKEMNRELAKVLGAADVVTMVKFVSAAASKDTSAMIEKIFKMMKPGAFVLFIDNAAGGFKELISNAALKYKFTAVSTPLKHQPYKNECFKNIKYGYRSCFETTVAVQLLMKPRNENFPSSPASHWRKVYVPRFQNFRIGPKPVNNSLHESFESQSPLNLHASNFSPLSAFSSRLNSFKAQTDTPENLYKFQPFYSSSPYACSRQNWPGRGNGDYENNSFGNELSCYSNEFDSPHPNSFASSPFPNRSVRAVGQMYNSMESPFSTRLNQTPADDSGFADNSFDGDMSFDSPISDGPPHFKAHKRVVTFRDPEVKASHYFQENESFWNTPRNNLPPHSQRMPYDENSPPSMPYRRNLPHLEQRPSIYFEGISNSLHNPSPLNSGSPFHQPWNSNRHPSFGPLRHSGPKRHPPPSYQHPRGYDSRSGLKHRNKPYERKVSSQIMKQLF